jgi:hypothetical protein
MSVSRYPIRIIVDGVGEAKGELARIYAPRTVETIVQKLPIEGRTSLWKDAEVYFNVPIKVGSEKPSKEVRRGTIAYWPLGSAICIFYKDLVPYSAVNVIGRIIEGIEIFKQVKNGLRIRIELIK